MYQSGLELGFCHQTEMGFKSALLLTSCETLGKFLGLSAHLQNGDRPSS